MLSIKLELNIDKNTKYRIIQYQKQYSNYIHISYNRLKQGLKQKECYNLKLYNNIQLLDFWFKQCATKEAKLLLKKNNKFIFGGKRNYFNRLKGLISKQQYYRNRLCPLYSIGQSKTLKSNRKFKLLNLNTILFKPNKKQHINLNFICNSVSYQRYLKLLLKHQQLKDIPITYRLTHQYIIISFDQKILQSEYKQYKPIKDRIISLDMNPNYIGYSIIDWKDSQQFNIIDKGVLSIKNINDYDNNLHLANITKEKKYITNKRNYEVLQCSKFLINKMIHYRCSLFVIEDLNIKRKDHNKGKRLNKLINNNWCRTKLVNNLQKWTNIYNVQLIKVKPQYSSFIGNIVYRSLQLPDMILSSIEISRRGYQFYHQYIAKDKDIEKNIVWINQTKDVRSKVTQSLEELGLQNIVWNNLFDLYNIIKKSKCKYRFPLYKKVANTIQHQQHKSSLSQKQLKFQLFNSF